MTLQQLREAAKGGFGIDESTADDFLTDTQWTRAINRAYRWLCRRARLLGATWTSGITTVDGTQEYSITSLSPLPCEITQVFFKRGGSSGQWTKLSTLSAAEVATLDPTAFVEKTGAPTHYWLRGSDKVGFYPIPDSTNAGASLVRLWGFGYPTALSNNSDTPTIIEPLQEWLIDPARYEMAKQERSRGRGDDALVQMYDRLRQQSLAECQAYVAALNGEPQYANWSQEDF
jgi:hypothetical protein